MTPSSLALADARWLRRSVAFLWLFTGLAVLHPYCREVGHEYLARLGLPDSLMYATCVFEVLLGLRVLFGPASTGVTLLQILLIAGFTTILGALEPVLFLHPFGMLTKNFPLLAVIVTAWLLEREGWTMRAWWLLRVGMALIWFTEGLFPKLLFLQDSEIEVVSRSPFVGIDPVLFLRLLGAALVLSGILALVLRGWPLRVVLGCQLLVLVLLPILVSIPEPWLWFHPFGPMTKNIPMIAGTAILLVRATPPAGGDGRGKKRSPQKPAQPQTRSPESETTLMFNIGYFKGQPTDYIIKYTAGRVTREGPGLAFFYFRYNTQVVAVPTNSVDANFVFNEATNNFQEVTIQGQLTYRIHNPKQASALLNFTIDPVKRSYVSNDPEKLARRISNVVQIETRSMIQKRSLEETLRDAQAIAAEALRRLKDSTELQGMGVELLSVYFLSTKPTAEVAKALEAEYRETLLRKADEAIYARRAASVDEERKIKEKELASERTLEEQRRELIVLQGNNAQQEAENRGRALELEAQYRTRAAEMELGVYRNLDPRSLLAYAMKEMGQNAQRVGNLTITSEVLASLLNGSAGPGQ